MAVAVLSRNLRQPQSRRFAGRPCLAVRQLAPASVPGNSGRRANSELSQLEKNVLGYITIRGYCEESDLSPEIASSLQDRGLIRFDRLEGCYVRT